VTPDLVVEIAYQSMYTAFLLSAPILITGLVVGLLVGIFQAATSIHEMTLTFIPKLIVAAVTLILFLPWMIRTMTAFTTRMFDMAATVIR
jgi:flagellar biosynthesis protein FliQ